MNAKRIIIAGATGMVGGSALALCQAHADAVPDRFFEEPLTVGEKKGRC